MLNQNSEIVSLRMLTELEPKGHLWKSCSTMEMLKFQKNINSVIFFQKAYGTNSV